MRSPKTPEGQKAGVIVTDRPVGCKCGVEHLRGPQVSKQFWGEPRASYQGIASAMPQALKIRCHFRGWESELGRDGRGRPSPRGNLTSPAHPDMSEDPEA